MLIFVQLTIITDSMNFKKSLAVVLSFCGLQCYAETITYDFEKNADDWAGRGDATVELSSAQHHTGSQSLFVSNRAESWHGALVQNAKIEAGNTYIITAYVFVLSNGNMDLSVQYSADGENSYPGVCSKEAYAYSWTELKGKIVIPDGVEDIQPYIQCTNNPTLEYYIDDVTIEEEVEDLIDFSQQLSLKDLYHDYFKFGTAATASEITPKNAKNMILHHFNSLTPGNELKPDAMLDQAASQEKGDNVNPQVKLSPATKSILKFCEDTKIPMRGHVFVWHSQTPDWFFNENFASDGKTVSKQIMSQRMENYIKNVIELVTTTYPGLNIYAWDIVNETFTDGGQMRQPGSNYQTPESSRWVEVYGDKSFIEEAFTYAKKYLPSGCKAYYNDYNEYIGSKRDAIYDLVKDLYAKGLCDGVGMQSHLSTQFPSVQLYKEALAKYATIGCDIQVTELDITIESGADYNTQAQMYGDLFKVYKEYKDNISLVAVWGINDEISWRASGKPLVFSNYQPKAAYNKIIEGMEMPNLSETAKNANAQIIVAPAVVEEETVIYCEGDFSFRLLNLVGDAVMSGRGNGELKVALNLPASLYLMEVTTANGEQMTVKIVKR